MPLRNPSLIHHLHTVQKKRTRQSRFFFFAFFKPLPPDYLLWQCMSYVQHTAHFNFVPCVRVALCTKRKVHKKYWFSGKIVYSPHLTYQSPLNFCQQYRINLCFNFTAWAHALLCLKGTSLLVWPLFCIFLLIARRSPYNMSSVLRP